MKIDIKPRYVILIVLFAFLVVYSLYQARALLLGPRVWISGPQDGDMINDPLVVMEGRSRNIAWISLNDRQIFTDEQGNWSEKLIVSEGVSIMTVKASDRFGREVKKEVQIVF